VMRGLAQTVFVLAPGYVFKLPLVQSPANG
jgi:hypothetical protein